MSTPLDVRPYVLPRAVWFVLRSRRSCRHAHSFARTSGSEAAPISFASSVRIYREAALQPWQPSHDRSPRVEAPTGITFLGRPYADAEMLRFAYAYEQATRHRRPPTTPP